MIGYRNRSNRGEPIWSFEKFVIIGTKTKNFDLAKVKDVVSDWFIDFVSAYSTSYKEDGGYVELYYYIETDSLKALKSSVSQLRTSLQLYITNYKVSFI